MNAPLCELLKQTSRSFYLTLRVLPAAVRPQIGLAYLLARTTDTIADTELVPLEQRLDALQKLRERILGTISAPLNFGEMARQQASPAERALLENVEAGLAALRELSSTDAQLIRQVLDTITSGQELDLRRFANATGARTPSSASVANKTCADEGIRAPAMIALQSDAELDDYTYRVAGCAGEFWTDICLEHEFSSMEILGFTELTAPSFEELGVRFGKGLQLVNILRDLPADLRKGRCYLPADKLSEAGLKPADLLQPANENKFRPLYNRYLDLAESHLAAGWSYTNTIPWPHMRVRLACAWPVLIGIETLKRLRAENPLDPERRIKISRAEVRGIILRSVLCYPISPLWKNLFSQPVSPAGKDVA
jgi:farnesyl-diphosphate farnesyltransferase